MSKEDDAGALADCPIRPFRSLVPIKCGLMTKEGGNFQTWKTRAFALEGEYLYYYVEGNDEKPRGVLGLSNCVLKDESNENSEKNGFVFSITPRVSWNVPERVKYLNRKYILVTSSLSEMNDWMATIRQATRTEHMHINSPMDLYAHH